MKPFTGEDIERAIRRYNAWPETGALPPGEPMPSNPEHKRSLSWDICFSHFQGSPLNKSSAELDRLHLGYYLASWGMLRGSAFLLKSTNALYYDGAINVIRQYSADLSDGGLRGFDIDHYGGKDDDRVMVERFSTAWRELHEALSTTSNSPSLTLMTKILAGVWGCIPALDKRARRSLKLLRSDGDAKFAENRNVNSQLSVLPGRLSFLKALYDEHESDFEKIRDRIKIFDPTTGEHTDDPVPKAKLLDMFLFQYTPSTGS